MVNAYERIPYVPAAAVQYMLDHPVDAQSASEMKKFDFHTVIDNRIVERLVKEALLRTIVWCKY